MDAVNTQLTNQVSTLNDIINKTREHARNQGRGANARANWLVDVVHAASDGVLDTVKRNKAGAEDKKNGKDHATLLYEEYVAVCSEANRHDAKTVISKASNLRKGIEMGNRNDIDGRWVINTAVAERDNLTGNEGVALMPAFEAFNAVIREQMKSDVELTREEIRDAMIKGEEKDKDAGTYIRAALKQVEKAYELDKGPAIAEALDAVNAALAWCSAQAEHHAAVRALAEAQAKAASLGLTL